jgi:hypothetical protein
MTGVITLACAGIAIAVWQGAGGVAGWFHP